MKKLVSIILTGGVFITLLPVVQAEEVVLTDTTVELDQSVDVSTEEVKLDQPEGSSDLDIPDVDQNLEVEEDLGIEAMQMMAVGDVFEPFLDYAVDPMSISKSLGVYETNLATGAATYQYPIYLPPGRNGFQPEIYLFYNNQMVLDDSIYGYGWDLYMGGSITRTKEYGTFEIYDNNEFYLNMLGASGELLPVSLVDNEHGDYGLQVEDAFYRYEFLADDSWVVTDQNGTEYYFGQVGESRQDDPNDSSRIFEWKLDEIRDVMGNYVRYEYFEDQGQIYPKAIYYTGYGNADLANDGPIEVRFQPFYDGVAGNERDDWTKWYDKGFEVKTDYILNGIDVLVEGNVVREYDISYTTGENGRRSMLGSIVETGTSLEGDVVTLPATEFEYSMNDGDYDFTYEGVYSDLAEHSHFTDINGDGYPDQTPFDHIDIAYPYVSTRLNSSGGISFWGEDFIANYATAGQNFTPADAGMYVDMNGDIVPEMAVLYDSPYISDECIYRNYGEGFIGQYSVGCSEGTIDRERRGYRLGDFDGDGLLDLFTGDIDIADWTASGEDIYLNTGAFEFIDSGYDSPVSFSWGANAYPQFYTGQDTGARIVDVNRDGLMDIVQAYVDANYLNDVYDNDTMVLELYLNVGDGTFSLDTDFDMQVVQDMVFASMQYTDMYNLSGTYYSNSNDMCYADFNGDRIVDLIKDSQVYIWDGVDTWTMASYQGVDFSPDCGGIYYGGNTYSYGTGDLNGDGLMDFFESLEQINNGVRGVNFNVEGKPDLLIGVSTANGAEISISYLSALQYEDGNGGFLNPDLPFAIYTAEEVFVDDGLGGVQATTYEYRDGHYLKYFDGYTGEFSKFGEVSVLQEGVETVYYFDTGCHEGELCAADGLEDQMTLYIDGYGWYVVDGDYLRYVTANIVDAGLCNGVNCLNGFDSYEDNIFDVLEEGEVWDDLGDDFMYEIDYSQHALKGTLYMVEVYDDLGNLYSRTYNEWDVDDLGGGRYFPHLDQVIEFDYEGENSARETAGSFTYNNDYGFVMTETSWGEVEADETTYEILDYMTGDEIYTDYSYAANEIDWVFGVAEVLITDDGGSTLSNIRNYYDYYGILGDIGEGLLTKESAWLDTDNSWVSTEYEYDSYGNVTLTRNPRGYETTVTYDSWDFYPGTITNPLLQSIYMTVNYVSGEPIYFIDYNGYEYFYTYDGLGRPIIVEGPSVDGLSTVTHVSYSYDDVSMPKLSHESLDDGTLDGFNTYTYLDGLGREVQIRVEGESDYSVADIVYDERGQVEFEGLTYFSGGSFYTGYDNTQPGVTYLYDGLGRVAEAASPMGTISTGYSIWEEIVTDPLGNSYTYSYDAYGNLIEVLEPGLHTTSYEYDLLGRLIEIEDSISNLRSFEYDSLGRMTMQEEMHDPLDGVYASWSYEYDENGNLSQMTVPVGDTVDYTYDELDRVFTEDSDGIAGVEVTYFYDNAVNGIGLVASVSYEDGGIAYEYDALSGIISEVRDIDGNSYEVSYVNDLMGRVEEIIYPSGSEVSYVFNEGAFVESVTYNGEVVVSDMNYSPMGQWQEIYYANGDVIESTYDPQQMYLLTDKLTLAADGVVLQDLYYEYDDVGNVLWISDESDMDTAKDVYYEYDDLHRLTMAVGGEGLYGLGFFEDPDGDDITQYEGDNCPGDYNPGQEDQDGDFIGNVCDLEPEVFNPGIGGPGFSIFYERTYEYDAISNMIYKSDIGDMLYEQIGNANPYALTSANGAVYEYDESGSMISDGTFDYFYNYKNQMLQSDDGQGGIVEYSYDFSGVRMLKEGSDGSTAYYPNMFYEEEWLMDGSGLSREYVFVDGVRILSSEMVFEAPFDYQLGTESMNHNWRNISFDEPFDVGDEIMVFSQIQTENGGHDAKIELDDVNENGFEIRIWEDRGRYNGWLDGWHTYEDVSWLAFDINDLPDGVYGGIEYFKQNGAENIIQSVTFDEAFLEVPIVYVQAQSKRGWHTFHVDITSVTETGFEMNLQEDVGTGTPDDWDGAHTYEYVGWIAFLPSENPFGGLAGTQDIGSGWENVTFLEAFDAVPMIFSIDVTENESDVSIVDMKNVAEGGFQVKMEELDYAGWDGIHIDEIVNWFAVQFAP